jgi:Tol biopolymer transport system component
MDFASRRSLLSENPGKLVRLPLFGGAPREVLADVTYADWNPKGTEIAAVRVVGSQQRLEYPLGTVLFSSEGEIGYPRVSPSGDHVAFFDWPIRNDDRGSVVVVDRAGTQHRIAGPYEAGRGLAWTPDGQEVWFGAASGTNDYELRAAGIGRPERRLYNAPTGLLAYDIDRDGRALVAQYDRNVYVELTTEGDPQPRDMSWRGGSFLRDISRDGRKVLLAYYGQGSSPNYDVYVRDVGGTDATRIGEGQPQQFSPDEQSVLTVVHGPPSRLVILPIGAGQPTLVPTGEVTVTAARWLPDGKRVLVIGTEPSARTRAYVLDLSGGPPRPVTPQGIAIISELIALSRDGTRLAAQSPESAFMIYSISGEAAVPVSGLQRGEFPIGWTPGDQALVVRDQQARRRLMAVDPKTGQRTLFRESAQADPSVIGPGNPVWTRDGRTFAAMFTRLTMSVYLVEGLK